MAKNKNLEKIALMRWDQVLNKWVPFTGSVGPGGHVQVEPWEVVPTDDSQTNPSFSLTWTSGNLTQIDQVINGVTYRQTLTWTSGNLTAISKWAVV